MSASVPEAMRWLNAHLSGAPADAQCTTCSRLFENLDGGLWFDKPHLLEVRLSGEKGCLRCDLIWMSLASALPNIADLLKDTIHGVLVTENGIEYLRIGIGSSNPQTHSTDPADWVDLFFDRSFELLGSPRFSLPSVGSDQWRRKVQSWIATCDDDHIKCTEPTTKTLPTRLIELKPYEDRIKLRLVDSFESPRIHYIALSYCWGRYEFLQTTCSNVEAHRKDIGWESIPLLFQEVILICKELNISYIWIDSLCILQSDTADWSHEASRMDTYYANAWLTIAADCSPGPNHSCHPCVPRPCQPLYPNGTKSPIFVSKLPTHFGMNDIPYGRPPSALPLFGRSWAYQERLISRRILHMFPDETVWECVSSLDCLCSSPADIWEGRVRRGLQPFLKIHQSALQTSPELHSHWDALLEMYLLRSLTYDEDKLKAIMALAKQLKHRNEQNTTGFPRSGQLGDYVFGLWSQKLPSSLLWLNLGGNRARNSIFPSYSWASLKGHWHYQGVPPEETFQATAVVCKRPAETWDIDSITLDQDHSDDLREIVLRGRMATASICRVPLSDSQSKFMWKLKDPGEDRDHVDTDAMIFLDGELSKGHSECSIQCLELGISDSRIGDRSWGIILSERVGKPGLYERLGIINIRKSWFALRNEETVSII